MQWCPPPPTSPATSGSWQSRLKRPLAATPPNPPSKPATCRCSCTRSKASYCPLCYLCGHLYNKHLVTMFRRSLWSVYSRKTSMRKVGCSSLLCCVYYSMKWLLGHCTKLKVCRPLHKDRVDPPCSGTERAVWFEYAGRPMMYH